MTITSQGYQIGTAVVNVVGEDENPQHVYLHNSEGTNSIWVGGENVTTTNGYEIEKKLTFEITIAPGDKLYAVASGAGRDLRVLIQRT